MKIYIIGIGMEGYKTLTEAARSAIENADVLIGAQRVLEPFSYLEKDCFISWKSDEIIKYLSGKPFITAAILMSGDCGFYSGAEKISKEFSEYDTEIICGISSPVYFCSKIQKPWQNMRFISLHGNDRNIIRNVCRNELCFFLLGGNINPADVCSRLCNYDRKNICVYIGENLGYETERIYSGIAADFTDIECGKLCVMITENSEFEHSVPFGINDNRFIRGNVPMTKSEIRGTVISKLNIGCNDVCWDIGCGTGSVSVEMALQCFDGKVYAVDKNSEAISLTNRNAHIFGCDNIKTIKGKAPEVLYDMPSPDKVFIGGSCGKINEILSVIYTKNNNADVVITAVSLETVNEAITAFEYFGITEPEIVQLGVTRTKKLGNHTMLSAENPIFIIKGVRI